MDSLQSLQPIHHPLPTNPAWMEQKTTVDNLFTMTQEIERVQRISQLIVREAPIRADLPLLPQLIERQRLLCSLIGPSPMISSLQNTQSTSHASAFMPTQRIHQNPLPHSMFAVPSMPTVSMPTVTLPLTLPTQVPVTIQQVVQYTQPTPTLVPQPRFMEKIRVPQPRPETPTDVVVVTSPSPPECPINPRKRKMSAEEASAAVSACGSSSGQHLFQLSEKNFTDSFTRQRSGSSSNEMSPVSCPSVSSARPTSEMVSILSQCHNNLKEMLSRQGISVNRDAHGMPVDYSSRPVDEIFKKARMQLEHARSFQSEKGTAL